MADPPGRWPNPGCPGGPGPGGRGGGGKSDPKTGRLVGRSRPILPIFHATQNAGGWIGWMDVLKGMYIYIYITLCFETWCFWKDVNFTFFSMLVSFFRNLLLGIEGNSPRNDDAKLQLSGYVLFGGGKGGWNKGEHITRNDEEISSTLCHERCWISCYLR